MQVQRLLEPIFPEISPMRAVPRRMLWLLQEHEVGRRNVGYVL